MFCFLKNIIYIPLTSLLKQTCTGVSKKCPWWVDISGWRGATYSIWWDRKWGQVSNRFGELNNLLLHNANLSVSITVGRNQWIVVWLISFWPLKGNSGKKTLWLFLKIYRLQNTYYRLYITDHTVLTMGRCQKHPEGGIPQICGERPQNHDPLKNS